MKKLLVIFLLFCGLFVKAQNQFIGSPKVTIQIRGGGRVDSSFLLPHDTLLSAPAWAVANIKDTFYIKDSVSGHWVTISPNVRKYDSAYFTFDAVNDSTLVFRHFDGRTDTLILLSGVISADSLTAPVKSVFGRLGNVQAQTGDYSVDQVTGAAPIASPTFTGTATTPALNISGLSPGTLFIDGSHNVYSGNSVTSLTADNNTGLTGGTITTTGTIGIDTFKIATRNEAKHLIDSATVNVKVSTDTSERYFGGRIAAWGNSLTAADTYEMELRKLGGVYVWNGGVSGEHSDQIMNRFLADTSKWAWSTIIWSGRNNYTDPTTVLPNIDTMISKLGHNRYVVMSVTNGGGEGIGTTQYTQIKYLDSLMKVKYGVHYMDVRAFLVSKYDPSQPADVTDFNTDIPPYSLRIDSVHYTTKGYQLIGDFIFNNAWPILMGRDSTKLIKSGYDQLGGFNWDVQQVTNKYRQTVYLRDSLSKHLLVHQFNYWNGSTMSTGTSSYGLGNNTLNANSGANVNGFGDNSLSSNTGFRVNGFGGDGVAQNNTGNDANFMGDAAGKFNTGTYANGIGTSVLQSNTGANSNIIGAYGASNNVGTAINGMGYSTMRYNRGNYMNGVGDNFGYQNIAVGPVGLGDHNLYYNNWPYRVSIGFQAGYTFNPNSSTTKTFTDAAINTSTDKIYIPAHGFGSSLTYVNLKFGLVSGTAPGGLSNNAIYQIYIVSADTIQVISPANISSTGSGTFSFTKDYDLTNSVELGYQARATTSHQFALATDITNTLIRGNKYTYPSALPSDSSLLGSDASGNLYWKLQSSIGGGGGGTGNPNSNIGSFYRWAVPWTNNIKTFANGYGVFIDSTTNTNALTATVDTFNVSTRSNVNHVADSLRWAQDNYWIQNQNSAAQTGNLWVNGNGEFNSYLHLGDHYNNTSYGNSYANLVINGINGKVPGLVIDTASNTYYALTNGRSVPAGGGLFQVMNLSHSKDSTLSVGINLAVLNSAQYYETGWINFVNQRYPSLNVNFPGFLSWGFRGGTTTAVQNSREAMRLVGRSTTDTTIRNILAINDTLPTAGWNNANLTVNGGVRLNVAGRWLRIPGLSSHHNATDSMMVWNPADSTVGFRPIPTGGGGGGVTSVATNDGTGIHGGTITTSGTLAIDTTQIATRDWTKHSIDSAKSGSSSPLVGTYLSRLSQSPSNGMSFYQTDDGRNAPAGMYYYLNGNWQRSQINPEELWYFFEDFGSTLANLQVLNGMFVTIAGSGASAATVAGNDAWLSQWSTGTSSTGQVRIASGNQSGTSTGFKASTADMYYQVTITGVSQKSNLTDVFNIDAGFGNATTSSSAPSTGYFFRYDSATSANWLYRNGSGSLTSTGVAFNANTAYTLEVLVRSDSAFYWINNSQVAAVATGANTTYVGPITRIVKTAGTTAVTMNLDYIKTWARLQTSRTNYGN